MKSWRIFKIQVCFAFFLVRSDLLMLWFYYSRFTSISQIVGEFRGFNIMKLKFHEIVADFQNSSLFCLFLGQKLSSDALVLLQQVDIYKLNGRQVSGTFL